jgi:tetrahydromethanopterin S-methyltransferase subunit G
MEEGKLPEHLINKEQGEAIERRWQMIDTSVNVT